VTNPEIEPIVALEFDADHTPPELVEDKGML
jgi:hypothetical protein